MYHTNTEERKSGSSKSSWVVQFNMNGIEYDGVIKNFSIEIPLIGEYLPANFEYVDENCQEIVNFFINNKYPVTEKGIKGLEMWAHTASVATNEYIPQMQSDKPEKEAMIWFNLGFWVLDDLFEKLVERKEILEARGNLKTFINIFREVWTGQFSTVDDIMTDNRCINSKSIHDLLPSLITFHQARQLLTKSIPGSEYKLDYFLQEYQQWLEANYFIFQTKLKYGNDYSLETYCAVRPREIGIWPFFEIAIVAAQVDLTSEIRSHFIFIVLQNLAGLAIGIVNDLYSLGKDIKEENSHNYVFILAKRKKISLEVAIDMTVDYVQNLICGIEKTGKQLIEEFAHDPVVIKVYDIIRHFCNGNATFSHWLERYGRVAGKAVRKV